MTTPNPPQNLQVVGPQQTAQAPVAPQAQALQTQTAEQLQKDYVDPAAPQDRILSPEETESFFRTGAFKSPNVPETPEELDQAQMAGDFFEGMPVDGQSPSGPMTPQAPPGAPTASPTPQQIEHSVQQTLQQGQPAQAPQVAPQPQQVPVPGAPAVPGQPVVPQQVPAQSPQEAALAAQVQTLTTQVQNLGTQLQQSQTAAIAAAQPAQQQAGNQQAPMQVPQQYMAALASENPVEQQAAMNAIVNGVAQEVERRTLSQVDQRMQTQAPLIQQQVTVAQEQANIKNDMYGTYPELSNMMEQVAAVATQLQNQGLTTGQWSPDLRDQIAERLAPLVPGLSQKVQSVRSARYGQQAVPNQQQQFLPQVPPQQVLPPGVAPAQIMGAAHVPQAPQQGPMLVRDAAGNVTQVYPQQHQQYAGPQARPGAQGQVDPQLQDIWSTLGY